MKTSNSASHVLPSTSQPRSSHVPSDPELPRAVHLSVFQYFFGLLCIEHNGALVCCIPGAPIVRLPH
ncbi:hypothetical protein JFV28_14875 [Pseudomonas sp. TH05]|uniref:hypothetical protein n=1 Tax=unclassified Pseudomonas TaxID=196821 RepID=UPI0009968FB8|nr:MULTISPECIES: hypothetical protein [unclassified Pseudomonas]MBK5540701.1 hypothetical protein [Pseudomonas sp. TH07]MBK5557145.1 hypothetical protein [Pseudomonas sp. TH05]OOV94742.1 hypothetical protein MF4836_18390 [Pseudomonas sp. MF4836]